MESRAFHGVPQVPLRHIVTNLVLVICHIHTCTPTNLWMSGNSPAVVKLLEHKGIGAWLRTGVMGGGMKWIWNVKPMSPQPFTMPWNERYTLPSHFMVLFFLKVIFENRSPSVLPENQSFNCECKLWIYCQMWHKTTKHPERMEVKITGDCELLSSWPREGKTVFYGLPTVCPYTPSVPVGKARMRWPDRPPLDSCALALWRGRH